MFYPFQKAKQRRNKLKKTLESQFVQESLCILLSREAGIESIRK